MTGHKGNSEFWFPETLNIPQGEAEGNIEVEGKQNSLLGVRLFLKKRLLCSKKGWKEIVPFLMFKIVGMQFYAKMENPLKLGMLTVQVK